jgi:hypothetical protein
MAFLRSLVVASAVGLCILFATHTLTCKLLQPFSNVYYSKYAGRSMPTFRDLDCLFVRGQGLRGPILVEEIFAFVEAD